MCEVPLYHSDKPLAFMAASKSLCEDCYIAQEEASLFMRHLDRIRRCEHLWDEWESAEIENSDERVFVRQCELCRTLNTVYAKELPPENIDHDISWCDLDRTAPEP
jgi:hypothetical protein